VFLLIFLFRRTVDDTKDRRVKLQLFHLHSTQPHSRVIAYSGL
jgi:hypothetical protein